MSMEKKERFFRTWVNRSGGGRGAAGVPRAARQGGPAAPLARPDEEEVEPDRGISVGARAAREAGGLQVASRESASGASQILAKVTGGRLVRSPAGTNENSPAIHRWGQAILENESRRDGRSARLIFCRPSGTRLTLLRDPAMNRRAIFIRPCGTR